MAFGWLRSMLGEGLLLVAPVMWPLIREDQASGRTVGLTLMLLFGCGSPLKSSMSILTPRAGVFVLLFGWVARLLAGSRMQQSGACVTLWSMHM